MSDDSILRSVASYYTGRLEENGATARGVDWNSTESQTLRFEQLLRLFGDDERPSVVDYGCGYGALVDFLDERGRLGGYQGYDVSEAMIARARELHAGRASCRFVTDEEELETADFTLASGIFNVRLETPPDAWEAYILATLTRLARLSTRGFAFNALTSYSDPERMREDLHYSDPRALFDHCKRSFSRNVALLHDYDLYEFTILVRL
jgi:SAM-dependent methyltransferase